MEVIRILGIDPGSRKTGWGIVEGTKRRFRHVANGTIDVHSFELNERLLLIHNELEQIIEMYQPDILSIEKVFVAKNPQSALKLGHARGVALITALKAGLTTAEYSPLEIKKAVTGYGKASKTQVALMVQNILRLPEQAEEDASDALATALCHLLNWELLGIPLLLQQEKKKNKHFSALIASSSSALSK